MSTMTLGSRCSAMVAAAIIALAGTATAAIAPAAVLSQQRAAHCCLHRCHHQPRPFPRRCCCDTIGDHRLPATRELTPSLLGLWGVSSCAAAPPPTTAYCRNWLGITDRAPDIDSIWLLNLSLRL